ncbi:MAG: hypothetical protein Q3999_08195 [Buchananella hordeovulneris]|nr:hypothetical protein [Buchananella hordeovulneris]
MKKSLLSLRNGAVVLAGVAIIFLIAAVLSATVFKPAARVEATLDAAKAKSPLLITAPGVLNILPGEVVATVTVPEGEQVAVAVGRTADVDGWSSQYSVVEVTGLVDWSTLDSVNLEPNPEASTLAPSYSASPAASPAASAAASTAASAAPTASASPAASAAASGSASPSVEASGEAAGSAEPGMIDLDTDSLQAALVANDMWTMAESGTGKVTLKFAPQADNTSLIAVGSKTAPTLTLSWVSPERSTFLLPGLLWALLFLALAAGLYFFDTAYRREEERRREAAAKRAAKRAATTQLMRAIDPNTERPLSRRELARLESGEGSENGEAGKADVIKLLQPAGAAITGFAAALRTRIKREPQQEQPEATAARAAGADPAAAEAGVAQTTTGAAEAGASAADEQEGPPARRQTQSAGDAAPQAGSDAAAEAEDADQAEASEEAGEDVVHVNAEESAAGEPGGRDEDESPVDAWADPDDPVTPVHPFFAPVAQELFPLGGEEDVEFAPVADPEQTEANAQDEEQH